MFLALAFYIVYLPTWLESSLEASGNSIALMFLVGGVAAVITGPQAGNISDKIGRRPMIIASFLGTSLVFVLTTLVTDNMWVANILFFFVMVLFSMRISPMQALLTALVPASRRGALLSMTVAIGQIGISLGGAVAGPIYGYQGFLFSTVVAAIAMLAAAWVVFASLPEPKPGSSTDRPATIPEPPTT
jgi:predicted MFS family arabinose efflux permease